MVWCDVISGANVHIKTGRLFDARLGLAEPKMLPRSLWADAELAVVLVRRLNPHGLSSSLDGSAANWPGRRMEKACTWMARWEKGYVCWWEASLTTSNFSWWFSRRSRAASAAELASCVSLPELRDLAFAVTVEGWPDTCLVTGTQWTLPGFRNCCGIRKLRTAAKPRSATPVCRIALGRVAGLP